MSPERFTGGGVPLSKLEALARRRRREKIVANVISVAGVVAIIVIVIALRLWIVGAEMDCFWARDVGLCMAVKGSGS